MDIVYIPNYNRAAFLAVNLELIAKTAQHKNLFYLFGLDFGFRRNLLPVISDWLRNHEGAIYEVPRLPQNYRPELKQSHALWHGYKKALSLNPTYIFMIEDDVMISNQFFNWHYLVQAAVKPFVSIGTRNNNLMPKMPNDTSVCGPYYLHPSYESLGICWTNENLKEVMGRFGHHYFTKPHHFLRQYYPNSPIGQQFYEQDGIIHRHIIANQSKVAWAWPPVSFHAGFFGKSGRAGRITGTLAEKKAMIKRVAFNIGELKKHYAKKGLPDYYWQDSYPITLSQKMGAVTECKYK